MRGWKYLLIILVILIIITAAVFYIEKPLNRFWTRSETEGKIAYVDLQNLFNEHPDKAEAEKQLNEIARSMQSELEEKAQDLPEEEQKELLDQYQNELSNQEQELIKNILDKIDQAVDSVAAKKEVKIVVDRKNVVYGGYNMTQDVIDYIKNNEKNMVNGSNGPEVSEKKGQPAADKQEETAQ